MKKISIFILIAVAAIILCGCRMGSNANAPDNTEGMTIIPDIVPDVIPDIETNIPDPDVDTKMPIYTDGTDGTDNTEK